ncbi:MAG: metallophosphoesterase [Candidatus Diapherotrites archaeon]
MKMLVLGDIHGKGSAVAGILQKTGTRGIDAVIIAGDLTTQGTKEEASALLEMLSFAEIFAVPGNMDSGEALAAMEEKNASVHCRKKEFNGMAFAGMGGGLSGQAGEILFTEKEIAGRLSELAENGCILVTHLPPKNSNLDLSGALHIGSIAVKKILLEKRPALHLCGHAHASRGIELIGKTLCVNAGPAKEGCAAIVEIKKGGKPEAELI